MDRFPKTVASFIYTGPRNRLLNQLNGSLLDAVRAEVLALRPAAELAEKIKIVEFGDGRWEYYPKVITTRPFTDAELAQVEAAREQVIAILQTELAAEGATNIRIEARPVRTP